ncbi:MAG: hypothetical protein ACHQTE_01070 [Candidatus Saccharimonadales bacterium]
MWSVGKRVDNNMALSVRRTSPTKVRVITTLIALFALVAQPGYGLVVGQVASAATTTSNSINVCKVETADCTHTEIQSAVDDATAGDTINIQAGTYNLASSINVNKPLTISGESNAVITADNINHAFNLNADDITVKGLVFTSFSKMTNDGYLYVHTKNVTIQSNIFAGQYNLGDAQVVRGIIVGPNAATNLTILNNYFHSLRQPAYIDNGTTGVVSNNFAQGTKGWVVGADSQLSFTGNSWGTSTANSSGNQKNAVDIAIIKNASTRDNYSDTMALSHANNNAAIDNQYEGNLSVAYVDAGAMAGGNGYWNSPFQTIQDASNAVSVGGIIELSSDITVNNQVTLTKALTMNGNDHTIFSTRNNAIKDTGNNSVLSIQSNDVTVNHLTVDGSHGVYLHGVNVWHADNVMLNHVTAQNNSNSGLNVSEGAKVTVDSLITKHNIWDGVDVDKAGAELTVNGTSQHDETSPNIKVDDIAVGAVHDTNGQYGTIDVPYSDNHGSHVTRLYNLKLAAPTEGTPTGFINKNDFWFTWSAVTHAASYEWQGSQSGETNPDGTLKNVTWTGDYQKVQPTNPTAHSVGASGTWYWQVRAVDAYGIKGAWSPAWSITVDTTKPAVPSSLSWIDSSNQTAQNGFTNVQKGTLSWKTTTPADVDHYVYKFWTNISGYQDDASHPWSDSYSYVVKTTDGGHVPTDFADKQGTYFFCVEAVDKAGNNSGCSTPLHITFDRAAPVSFITGPQEGDIVHGTVTVSGTVTDVNPDHYYFVVKDAAGVVQAGPGTVTQAVVSNWNWDTTKVVDGTYLIDLEARDKAGNKDSHSTATVHVTVHNAPVVLTPSVSAGDFATWDNQAAGFKAVNVGFGITNFTAVKNVTVDLYRQGEATPFMTNTATLAFLQMMNDDKLTNLSTPFIVSGNLHDTYCDDAACWTPSDASYVWTTTDKPTKAVVNVTNQDDKTYSVTLSGLSEADIAFKNMTTPAGTPNTSGIGGPGISQSIVPPATNTPSFGPVANPAPTTSQSTLFGSSSNGLLAQNTPTNDTAILGTKTASQPSASDATAAAIAPSSQGWKIFGIAWYWWLLLIAAVAAAAYWIAAAKRRSDNA